MSMLSWERPVTRGLVVARLSGRRHSSASASFAAAAASAAAAAPASKFKAYKPRVLQVSAKTVAPRLAKSSTATPAKAPSAPASPSASLQPRKPASFKGAAADRGGASAAASAAGQLEERRQAAGVVGPEHASFRSYEHLLREFFSHRSVGRLLMAADAPHPLQVYEDVEAANKAMAQQNKQRVYTLSAQDRSGLVAHCHVLLRILADAQGGDEAGAEVQVDAEASTTGQLVLKNKKEANPALHNCYSDTLALWKRLREDDGDESADMLDAALRCCSVLADTETAMELFDGHPNRAKAHKSPKILTAMIWVYAEKGDMAKCVMLYHKLKALWKKPSTDAFEALIHCSLVTGEVNTLLRTWQIFNDLGVKPRMATWESTILGCLDNGFKHHAVMFHAKYMKAGGEPSAYLQMRYSSYYQESVTENLQMGSKLKNAVARSPHLSYKLMLDFCRVRSMRDVTFPDHVPSVQTHYFATVDGAGKGMGIQHDAFEPRGIRGGQGGRAFMTHSGRSKEFFRNNHMEQFAPPGAAVPMRKGKSIRRAVPMNVAQQDFRMVTGVQKEKVYKNIHNYTGNSGSGAWADEGFSLTLRDWQGP